MFGGNVINRHQPGSQMAGRFGGGSRRGEGRLIRTQAIITMPFHQTMMRQQRGLHRGNEKNRVPAGFHHPGHRTQHGFADRDVRHDQHIGAQREPHGENLGRTRGKIAFEKPDVLATRRRLARVFEQLAGEIVGIHRGKARRQGGEIFPHPAARVRRRGGAIGKLIEPPGQDAGLIAGEGVEDLAVVVCRDAIPITLVHPRKINGREAGSKGRVSEPSHPSHPLREALLAAFCERKGKAGHFRLAIPRCRILMKMMKKLACHVLLSGLLAGFLHAQDQAQATGWETPSAPLPGQASNSDLALVAPAPPPPPPAAGGAIAAMMAINPKYTEGMVVVTARGGTPQPKEWTIVARDTDDLGVLHKLTVADGQEIADVQSLNAYESFRQDVNIDPAQVQVDSSQAFFIAQPIAAANQKIIGHVDYALTIQGKDATPIWTVNCFDINGVYIGKVVLLATNGAVLQTPGFANAPSAN